MGRLLRGFQSFLEKESAVGILLGFLASGLLGQAILGRVTRRG